MSDSFHAVQWETFVVRVWHEPANGAWRGEIVHVPDRTSIHFASFAQAEEFMRHYVGGTETGPPGGPGEPADG
ncbi:MAG TPA: hypothetical protein VLG46_09690 [Anaerolineae bacterium]|nr:hypothetical protein [Anaerolineae bacterium]